MISEEQDFEYDEEGEISVLYYILGEIPIKLTCEDSFPFRAERGDYDTKSFILDNGVIKRINDSADVRKVSEADFRNFCLSRGIKPI
ncbi:MAG: hypothetical protein IPH06_09380 [Alphaproteobacteria bacterium]|nr:hypothetical protein [Alphaproteobacteria bacterium]QQS58206.1 MAG: hypothetical protein IPN28_05140 [Alphaproteobacteria bacterium]